MTSVKNVLGPYKAIAVVIEYQKRGNIHCHIVLGTTNRRELSLPQYIDSVVSAEIPDRNNDPELYDLVSEKMIHGPCTPGGNHPCMRQGRNGERRCRFSFPKERREEIAIDSRKGYPLYRRRCRFFAERRVEWSMIPPSQHTARICCANTERTSMFKFVRTIM